MSGKKIVSEVKSEMQCKWDCQLKINFFEICKKETFLPRKSVEGSLEVIEGRLVASK